MQNVASLLPHSRGELARMSERAVATETQKGGQSQMGEQFNDIFNQICTHCPAWRAAYPTDDAVTSAKKVWFKVLVLQGHKLGKTELAKGMQWIQARRKDFLPSPQEFLDNCLVDSIPSMAACASELKTRQFSDSARAKPHSHPIVKWMAHNYGGLFHPETDKSELDHALPGIYRDAVELFRAGKLAETDMPRLPAKPMDPNLEMYHRLLSFAPDMAQEHLEECRKRGIKLDVEAGAVTRTDANLRQTTTATTQG